MILLVFVCLLFVVRHWISCGIRFCWMCSKGLNVQIGKLHSLQFLSYTDRRISCAAFIAYFFVFLFFSSVVSQHRWLPNCGHQFRFSLSTIFIYSLNIFFFFEFLRLHFNVAVWLSVCVTIQQLIDIHSSLSEWVDWLYRTKHCNYPMAKFCFLACCDGLHLDFVWPTTMSLSHVECDFRRTTSTYTLLFGRRQLTYWR